MQMTSIDMSIQCDFIEDVICCFPACCLFVYIFFLLLALLQYRHELFYKFAVSYVDIVLVNRFIVVVAVLTLRRESPDWEPFGNTPVTPVRLYVKLSS